MCTSKNVCFFFCNATDIEFNLYNFISFIYSKHTLLLRRCTDLTGILVNNFLESIIFSFGKKKFKINMNKFLSSLCSIEIFPLNSYFALVYEPESNTKHRGVK